MRKRATEGTKIRTSPSITKKIVSTRRRADRLCNSTLSLASAQARQQADEPAGAWRKQGGRKKAAGSSLARLSARRVGDDQIGNSADLELLGNGQGPGKDQIAGPGAKHRDAEDRTVTAGVVLVPARGNRVGPGSGICRKW